jgi:heat shock protein HtpX
MNFRTMQAANRRKTIGLLMGMGVLMWGVVYAALSYFGGTGAGIVPIAVGISLISVWGSDDAPNAFATGRNPEHALIAFTTGILDVMDRDQLQGVIAHELAHVANRDTLVSAVAATTAGAIAIVSDVLARMMFFGGRRENNNANPIALLLSLVILIMAPLAAVMLKSAISRKRESLADATAVSFTRNPAGLRSALEVLAADSTVVQQRSTAVAHIWIESPLDSKSVSKMFSTHPPIQERIAVLKSMESLG